MTTVVIGIGNRTLSDDAVGCVVAERVGRTLGGNLAVEWREVHTGGLRLMEAMAGFDRAILIDAIQTGASAPGTIVRPAAGGLAKTRNTFSSHDGSLRDALAFGRHAGLKLPTEIRIWAIEVQDVTTFSERLTEPVERAAAELVAEIAGECSEAMR